MARNQSKNGHAKNSLLQSVKKHPIRTASIAAGAVVGVALLRKAANTASRVVTIKAVSGAAKDIAGAVRDSRKGARTRGGRGRAKARKTPKA